MKWRAVMAVLFVLTLFAGFAYLYVNTFVRKHQHSVILFIVNGLDLNTLNLARQQLGRSPLQSDPDDPSIGVARRAAFHSGMLNLDSFWNLALLNIQERGQPVPDEGVDSTALACGQRVENGLVGINGRNEPLLSLIYAASRAQRATGLVTTSSLVEPTPVAFYSTIKGKRDPARNAMDLLYSGIDIVLGGGEQYFVPANATNEYGRRDGRNLLNEARTKGFAVVTNRNDLKRLSTWRTRQLFGVFAPDEFCYSSLKSEDARQPTLSEMTQVAISSLNYNINGYFLVVEQGLVAKAGEQNLGKLAVNEVVELDQAIQSAVEYAGPDALIIVTNNYSLGAVGYMPPATASELVSSAESMTDNTKSAKNAPVARAPIPSGPPQPSWLAGPGGPPVTPSQVAWVREHYDNSWFSTNAPGLLQPQPALRFQTRAIPMGEPAWLASRGEGSSQLRGFFNNTDVFNIIVEQF